MDVESKVFFLAHPLLFDPFALAVLEQGPINLTLERA